MTSFDRPHQPLPPDDRPASQRYVTWRYADRKFGKVHVMGADGLSLCGRKPGREVGRPKPPIPEDSRCVECSTAAMETPTAP